jgi:hypothetical protein
MSVLETIQQMVLARKVRYSFHAIEEKLEEINIRRKLFLTSDDIDQAIFTGEIITVFDNDVRGRRYAILGFALDDETELEIICRIEDNVVIITVYEQYF